MSPRLLLGVAIGVLYLFWSNSFVAMSYLLGSEQAAPRLDALGLTVARYLPVTPIAAAWLLLARRGYLPALWSYRWRLLAAGLLAVPTYGLCLYWGIQQGIPAPVAALLTALSPLYLMVLGATTLGERLGARKLVGFAVAATGLVLVATARGGLSVTALLPVAVAACAPLSWALVTVIGKPLSSALPADVWTAGYLVAGGVPTLLLLPWSHEAVLALDSQGWAAVAFLSLGCTLVGFVLWTWIAARLPASSAGFTVFLNPPMSLASQAALSLVFPATFVFNLRPLELIGELVVLLGMAIALLWRPPALRATEAQ